MASASARQTVVIHILDLNDNAPFFLQNKYHGQILESSDVQTIITQINNR